MNATKIQIDLHSFHSDVFKEVHGIRPRWMGPADCTEAEWQARIDRLVEESRRRDAQEAELAAQHAAWVAQVTDPTPLRVPLAAFMAR